MNNYLQLMMSALIIATTFTACDIKGTAETDFENDSNSIQSQVHKNVFAYKGAYVGDNSAVINIANQLKGAEYIHSFELKTDKAPYGVIIKYNLPNLDNDFKKIAINDATYLFTLLRNADFINFRMANEDVILTKAMLIKWYGDDFTNIDNEQQLKAFIMTHLDENNIDELFQ